MRLSKFLAHRGVASRRQVEDLIRAGSVSVDGVVVTEMGTKVTGAEDIAVKGDSLPREQDPAFWLMHKPAGVITSRRDPEGRETVFDLLPPDLPRLVTVGRLDFNSEGLLVLTNHPPLAHFLENPIHAFLRTYRVRIFGMSPAKIFATTAPMVVDGVRYKPLEVEIESRGKSSFWVILRLKEGKNREIRRIISHLGGKIDRLIRTGYGPFSLEKLQKGKIKKVEKSIVNKILDQLP